MGYVPPLNPPGPAMGGRLKPPFGADTSIVPRIVTSPWARMNTGVFALFGANLTVTLGATFMVVKLKMWFGGSRKGMVNVQESGNRNSPLQSAVVPGGSLRSPGKS